ATPARSSPAPATACAGAGTAAMRSSFSFARDDVTQAAHGLDEVGAELLAQAVDVNLDRVAADLVLPAVEFFLQLRAREHGAGALQHRLEHGPFACRQLQRFAIERRFTGGRIEAHALVRDHRLRPAG